VGEQAMTNSGAENRGPVGPRARAGQARLLTSHVPIRFRAQTIEKAKTIAERDGMTVSSWIRGVVEREVERRMPAFPQTHRSESGVTVRIIRRTDPTVEAETQNRSYDPDRAQLESA
jgi:antitoxin component of RelBE/YafQ-DinJ toxin-antitoxin module